MSESKTVMIVDDSRVSRMMIIAILKDIQPGWNIIEASNAEQCLQLASDKKINYFSIDLNMPGIDGLELIQTLKTNFPNAKFALLTANIQDATHQRAATLGALCINKPISEICIKQMLEHFNA